MFESSKELTQAIGNNAFSYKERIALGSTGKLYIPSIIQGTVADLQQGSDICFEEVENNKLISCTGLKNFLQTTYHGVPVYIVDNHNHALSFRQIHRLNNSALKRLNVIHIDQHTDLKPNEHVFSGDTIETFVNEETNVGNFITAAINSGIINETIQVRSDYILNNLPSSIFNYPFILDIDIDFREGKKDIEHDFRIVRRLMKQAQLVTIATSPYFMGQARAIQLIQQLMK